jgi:hypothetical protein
MLGDGQRYLTEDPGREAGALFLAQRDSSQRSLLAKAGQGPEPLAQLLAWWTVERADRATFAESLAAARAAAESRGSDAALAADLDEFVRGCLDGTIRDEAFLTRLKKPRRPDARRRRPPPAPVPPGAVAVSQAREALASMFGAGPIDPRAAWDVFTRFAARPVVADPPEGLESDLGLFQWGVYEWGDGKGRRFELDFTRQFSLCDEDGDYDRMEQLHCTLYFAPVAELGALGSGTVWSDGDLGSKGSVESWGAEVEQTRVFSALADAGPPVEHRIEQEIV